MTEHLVTHRIRLLQTINILIIAGRTRSPCFFMKSPLGALYRYLCLCRAQSLSGASSPVGLRSMSVLLVCAVMAHLEYNRHSCLDKARLVCLRVLFASFPLFSPSFFSFFLLFFVLPVASRKDFYFCSHSSTCLLYIRSICLCQLP